MSIFKLAADNHKGIVAIVNKWDLNDSNLHSAQDYVKLMHHIMAPFNDVPVIFTSVPEKQRMLKALETAMEVYKNRKKKISTSLLNDTLQPIIEANPPPSLKSKYIKIKYITQLPTYFPAFAFFCNHPNYIREDYKRFLENQLREKFNFSGCPIEIYFRQK